MACVYLPVSSATLSGLPLTPIAAHDSRNPRLVYLRDTGATRRNTEEGETKKEYNTIRFCLVSHDST